MIKRTILFRYRFICYDDRETNEVNCKGDKHNWPTGWYAFESFDIKDEFPQTLPRWSDIVADQFEKLLKVEGEKNCIDTAKYLHLCEYEYVIVNVREEEVPEERKVPKLRKYEKELLELLERRYREAETVDEKLDIREQINKIKEKYGIE